MKETPQDINKEPWTLEALEIFNPLKLETVTKEERVSKAGGKYSIYIVTFSPLRKPTSRLSTQLYKSQWDKIRAILLLEPTALINVSYDPVSKKTIFSGHKTIAME